VGVKKDEHIDGPITAILVIIAFKLAGLSRNRLAGFADQLGRTFVETNNGPQRVRRCGIEIQHILHPGDKFAIDLGNTPHVLAPRF